MLMICDPSHISGKREYIQGSFPASDGFGVRRTDHRIPYLSLEIALSDAAQQVHTDFSSGNFRKTDYPGYRFGKHRIQRKT